ncbi:MAG: ribonuclease P protein component [Chitinophagaceae bacterium]|nr:ribonuclease P protein component [Chitinophagaceae bacterium]
MKTFTFNKQERLKSRKLIEQLFSDGQGFSIFPLKVLYAFTQLSTEGPLQASVSVSSRNFKKAVDRNRIKRQLREVYRLQRGDLSQQIAEVNKQLALFFIYTGKELPGYNDLLGKMKKTLSRLQDIVANNQKID